MTLTAPRRLALATIALLFLAVAAACGDDDDSVPGVSVTEAPTFAADDETYFMALEAALTDVNAQQEALDQMRAEAFGPDGSSTAVAAFGDAYEQFLVERDTVVHEVTSSEATASRHAALGTATGDMLEFGRELNAALQSDPPATEAEYLALLDEMQAANAAQRYRDACTDLQVYASNNEIQADLQCLQ